MFLFLFISQIWKNILFISMVYINECIDANTALKKIPSNLWVVCVGSISFQEISYAGKPQVVSRYILSNLWPISTKIKSSFLTLVVLILSFWWKLVMSQLYKMTSLYHNLARSFVIIFLITLHTPTFSLFNTMKFYLIS